MENEVFTFKLASRKNAYGEWVVYCYRNGKRYPAGDAFETDKLAAEGTLAAAIKHEEERQAATGVS